MNRTDCDTRRHGEGLRLRGALFVVVLLGVVHAAPAQDSTNYPYGCVEDETLRTDVIDFIGQDYPSPLRCSTASFRNAQFDSLADFSFAQFDSLTIFRNAQFDSGAGFFVARFHGWSDFLDTRFHRWAEFMGVEFDDWAYFEGSEFYDGASFHNVHFHSRATFRETLFHRRAFFDSAEFDTLANFDNAQFDSLANFTEAHFHGRANFAYADFWGPVDFRRTRFDSSSAADFIGAAIYDTLFLGDRYRNTVQRFDLRQTTFFPRGHYLRPVQFTGQGRPLRDVDSVLVRVPGATVVLESPVELQMQVAKIDFLHLADNLSYFEKEDVIIYLKDKSFPDDELAQFELDYLLARSTMFQSYTGVFRWYDWVLYVGRAVYWATMGLGYRPYRIFYWAAGMILIFALYYRLRMPRRIYAFVQGKEKKPPEAPQQPQALPPLPTWKITIGRFRLGRVVPEAAQAPQAALIEAQAQDDPGKLSALNPWIHCLYFSTSVFFTFRLKQKILIFFDTRERRVIVFQWVLGFGVYLFFLLGAKSGSILQQLKTLFVG